MGNLYLTRKGEILNIVKHTPKEWTFTIKEDTENLKPGQFYEISMPKYGESPISVSGIGEGTVDFTIRAVGRVTDELFKMKEGDHFFIRGPYGNGFDVRDYEGREIVITAGGSGLAPVRGVIEWFYKNNEKCQGLTVICGFRSPSDILFKEDIKRWEGKCNIILTVDKGEEGYKGEVGLVTKYIEGLKIKDKNNVAAIVVGPPMMMKFTVMELQKANIKDENIWVSYERKMSCGVGKCGHCRMDSTYICVDGPVFNYSFGKTLYD